MGGPSCSNGVDFEESIDLALALGARDLASELEKSFSSGRSLTESEKEDESLYSEESRRELFGGPQGLDIEDDEEGEEGEGEGEESFVPNWLADMVKDAEKEIQHEMDEVLSVGGIKEDEKKGDDAEDEQDLQQQQVQVDVDVDVQGTTVREDTDMQDKQFQTASPSSKNHSSRTTSTNTTTIPKPASNAPPPTTPKHTISPTPAQETTPAATVDSAATSVSSVLAAVKWLEKGIDTPPPLASSTATSPMSLNHKKHHPHAPSSSSPPTPSKTTKVLTPPLVVSVVSGEDFLSPKSSTDEEMLGGDVAVDCNPANDYNTYSAAKKKAFSPLEAPTPTSTDSESEQPADKTDISTKEEGSGGGTKEVEDAACVDLNTAYDNEQVKSKEELNHDEHVNKQTLADHVHEQPSKTDKHDLSLVEESFLPTNTSAIQAPPPPQQQPMPLVNLDAIKPALSNDIINQVHTTSTTSTSTNTNTNTNSNGGLNYTVEMSTKLTFSSPSRDEDDDLQFFPNATSAAVTTRKKAVSEGVKKKRSGASRGTTAAVVPSGTTKSRGKASLGGSTKALSRASKPLGTTKGTSASNRHGSSNLGSSRPVKPASTTSTTRKGAPPSSSINKATRKSLSSSNAKKKEPPPKPVSKTTRAAPSTSKTRPPSSMRRGSNDSTNKGSKTVPSSSSKGNSTRSRGGSCSSSSVGSGRARSLKKKTGATMNPQPRKSSSVSVGVPPATRAPVSNAAASKPPLKAKVAKKKVLPRSASASPVGSLDEQNKPHSRAGKNETSLDESVHGDSLQNGGSQGVSDATDEKLCSVEKTTKQVAENVLASTEGHSKDNGDAILPVSACLESASNTSLASGAKTSESSPEEITATDEKDATAGNEQGPSAPDSLSSPSATKKKLSDNPLSKQIRRHSGRMRKAVMKKRSRSSLPCLSTTNSSTNVVSDSKDKTTTKTSRASLPTATNSRRDSNVAVGPPNLSTLVRHGEKSYAAVGRSLASSFEKTVERRPGAQRPPPVGTCPPVPPKPTVPKPPRLSTSERRGERIYSSTVGKENNPHDSDQNSAIKSSPPRSRCTEVQPFNLSHSNIKTDTSLEDANRSLTFAEQIEHYNHHGLREAPHNLSSIPLTRTVPRTPKVLKRSLTPARQRVKSSVEQEEEMMAQIAAHPFRARPSPFSTPLERRMREPLAMLTSEEMELAECAKLFRARKMPDLSRKPPTPCRGVVPPTTPSPFKFRTELVPNRHACPPPSKDEIELTKKFKARGLPDLSVQEIPTSRSGSPKNVTVVEPLHLSSSNNERRKALAETAKKNILARMREKKKLAAERRRQHLEELSLRSQTSSKNEASSKEAKPFRLLSEERGRVYEEQLQERIRQEEEQAKQYARGIKASPLPDFSRKPRLSPKKSVVPLTEPVEFRLLSEERHKRNDALLKERLQQEEEAMKAATIVKARRIPRSFYKAQVSPLPPSRSGRKPITAVAPALHTEKKAALRKQYDERSRQLREREEREKQRRKAESDAEMEREVQRLRQLPASEGGFNPNPIGWHGSSHYSPESPPQTNVSAAEDSDGPVGLLVVTSSQVAVTSS